ncbi:MAG: type II toxin-antitoxin system ParD family antitoxin [Planctomycetes bacterium]|jgi:putative addiction module CopG family antidote|nr:type II toxin-antitoxin system ParD family antitoxin [Planctomycetota bacterium]
MGTRTLVIRDDLDRFLEDGVTSARYTTASEMVEDGLRLLMAHDAIRQKDLARIREQIEEGYLASERGELLDAEEVFAELRAIRAEDKP